MVDAYLRSVEATLSGLIRTDSMRKALQAAFSLFVAWAFLVSCGDDERAAARNRQLATDIQVAIADHTLVLPFAALERYAYRSQSFSFDREGGAQRERDAADRLLRDAAVAVNELAIVVRAYGWNDSDMRQREMCALLTRAWARSVCDNPWAAIRQALPYNRFTLVNLSELQIGDPSGPIICVGDERSRVPRLLGEAVMVCEALVYGGEKDEFHHAIIRIDGELGAHWIVWNHGQFGEAAEAMMQREGQAIFAFVQHALGEHEDFQALHRIMCNLRRPGSRDAPGGADCPS